MHPDIKLNLFAGHLRDEDEEDDEDEDKDEDEDNLDRAIFLLFYKNFNYFEILYY
jgi:hypothetical protein